MLSHWSNDKLVHETEIFQKENKQLIEVWVDFLHSTREIGCKICSLYDLQIVEMVVLMLLCTLLDSSAEEHGHLSKVWEEVDLTLREHQTIPKQVTRGEQPALSKAAFGFKGTKGAARTTGNQNCLSWEGPFKGHMIQPHHNEQRHL